MTTEIVLVVALLAAMWLSTRMPAYQPTLAERMVRMTRDMNDASRVIGEQLIPTIRDTTEAVKALRRSLAGSMEPINALVDSVYDFHDEGNDE